MKRRFIAVLAAAALTTTLGAGISPAAAEAPPGAAYVAIGDSVASGNGLLPYYDTACLRSKKAYPTVLAGMLGGSVVSAACSGSSTGVVAAQAAGLAAAGVLGEATQLVTITAGVNNLPWIQALGACSNLGSVDLCLGLLGSLGQVGPGIGGGIAQVIGVVRQSAPNAQIVVTGYPLVFGPFSGTCSVGYSPEAGSPMYFAQPQGGAINQAVVGLNQAIQGGIGAYQAAFFAQTGQFDPAVQYVDVTAAFAGHGLCDSGDKWISGLVGGMPKDRGFHPNVAGQQAYAQTIAAALAG